LRRKLKNIITKSKRNNIVNINFEEIQLNVDWSDAGGRQYDQRQSYEEIRSLFYKDLASTLNPSVVLDIGANYGFTALIFRKKFPNAKLMSR
jgi:hypothetical protein